MDCRLIHKIYTDDYKSLLSSRLYCRYRNSFLSEGHRFGCCEAVRGLYRRLGLTPDPEDFIPFTCTNITLYKRDFKWVFGICEISFSSVSLFNIDISELISLQHINRNCYNFTIFSTLCISFQIQKPVCLS